MRAFRSLDSAGQTTAVSTSAPSGPAQDSRDRALARFKAVLAANGSRLSTVREAIARVALELRGHFEANDIVRELRTRNVRDAHLATVYRTLPLLVQAGLIQPALFSSGERAFYEASFERPHHDHLICTGCGVVVEFELEAIESLQRDLARCHGFELTAHYHELLGECTSCRTGGRPASP
jgi:Fur family transcriptional regulator, ferric uptake regulator